MSLTYPADEARRTTRLGIEAAFAWTAGAFILGGATATLSQALLTGAPVPWIAIAAFGALALLTWMVRAWRRMPLLAVTATIIVSAVLVGAIGWALGRESLPQTFILGCALIAATAIGSNADRWTGSIGTLLGYLSAETALILAPEAGIGHVAPLIIAVVVSLYYAFLALARRASRSASRSLDDAALVDVTASEVRALEQHSRALVHDTVLSDLVALGMTRPGPLSPATRASIAASLEAVRGPVHATTGTPAAMRDLASVLDRAETAGLQVDITGDPGALTLLDEEARSALIHAIDQALANVRAHAGVNEAEVSLAASGGSVMVTVVDGGVGFLESEIPADRFGFRESIRGRLEAVGGQARILSRPGAGTSIVLMIPTHDDASTSDSGARS